MAFRFHTTKQRSELMRKIRSNNTLPEVFFRRRLWGRGLRFNRKPSNLPGKPDIVLRKYKLILFIDGEFWHGYNWNEKKKTIKANRAYWIPKIERNILRDKENTKILRKLGWTVLRFWQHKIETNVEGCVARVERAALSRSKERAKRI